MKKIFQKDKQGRILVNLQEYDDLFSKYCSHPRAMTYTEYKNWSNRVKKFVSTYAKM